MINQDNIKTVLTGEGENNQTLQSFSPTARKRWNGTIGRLLQTVIESEKHLKHKTIHQ